MLNLIKFSDLCGKKNVQCVSETEKEGTVCQIPVNEIKPNPNQLRKFFKRESIDELICSVKKFGVCQPILVRNINNKFYELISGERRLMAAKGAGLDKIPAIILATVDLPLPLLPVIAKLSPGDIVILKLSMKLLSIGL